MKVIIGLQYSRPILDRTYDLVVLAGPDSNGVYETMRHGGPMHGQRVWVKAEMMQDTVRVYDRRVVRPETVSAADLARELECPIDLIDDAHAR